MKLKSLIYDLIHQINVMFPKPPIHTEEEKKAIEKEIVSRYAEGNISLYFGNYITEKEIEKMKAELATYRF